MKGKLFKDLYRNINIRMSKDDEKLLFDYLQLNGPTASNVDMEMAMS